MSLNITILQGAFYPVPPVRGGAVEKLWYQLGREFAAQGHRVTQISRAVPELPAEETIAGVKHVRVAGYDQPSSGLILKLRDWQYTRRALRACPPADILITNTFFAPLLARPTYGKIYVSVERMPKGQMRFYRRAARLRACSNAVGDAIKQEAPALADRVKTIPNPLPFVPTTPMPALNEKKDLLYVGRIHPAKGLELLLPAFLRAKKQGLLAPEHRLTLVGPAETAKGGGGEAWWNQLQSQYHDEHIRWLGPIYNPDALNDLYKFSLGFVYPTIDATGEAMPVAPLEAMAWGCVPVVSKLACFRDYIIHGQNGIVFDHLSADPVGALAQALGTALSPSIHGLSRAAALVRHTHCPQHIAGLFLSDFTDLCAKSS